MVVLNGTRLLRNNVFDHVATGHHSHNEGDHHDHSDHSDSHSDSHSDAPKSYYVSPTDPRSDHGGMHEHLYANLPNSSNL